MMAAALAWAGVAVGIWLTVLFLRGRRPAGVLQAAHAGLGAAAVAALGFSFPWADQPQAFVVLATALASGAVFWLLFKPLGVSRGLVLLSHGAIGLAGAVMLVLAAL